MTLTDRLERFFREHPDTWIDGKDLAGTAGTYAWRSRVSDVRRRLRPWGYTITNRQRRVRLSKDRLYTVSEYRMEAQP